MWHWCSMHVTLHKACQKGGGVSLHLSKVMGYDHVYSPCSEAFLYCLSYVPHMISGREGRARLKVPRMPKQVRNSLFKRVGWSSNESQLFDQ